MPRCATMPDPATQFARMLQSKCEAVGLSGAPDLHERLTRHGVAVTQPAVRHWLAGTRRPRAHLLECVLDVLDMRGGSREMAYRLHREAGRP